MLYEKSGFEIKVTLNDSYIIEAKIVELHDLDHIYDFTMYLNKKDIDSSILVSSSSTEIDTYRIESQRVNYDVANYILRLNEENFFTPYIEKYEYELKCKKLGERILKMMDDFIWGFNSVDG